MFMSNSVEQELLDQTKPFVRTCRKANLKRELLNSQLETNRQLVLQMSVFKENLKECLAQKQSQLYYAYDNREMTNKKMRNKRSFDFSLATTEGRTNLLDGDKEGILIPLLNRSDSGGRGHDDRTPESVPKEGTTGVQKVTSGSSDKPEDETPVTPKRIRKAYTIGDDKTLLRHIIENNMSNSLVLLKTWNTIYEAIKHELTGDHNGIGLRDHARQQIWKQILDDPTKFEVEGDSTLTRENLTSLAQEQTKPKWAGKKTKQRSRAQKRR